VRILIADDYPLVRRAIRRLLAARPGWEVVAEAADGNEAIRLAGAHQPDLAIVDGAMPALSGIQAVRQIARVAPATRILMLSIYDEEPYVIEALEAGAAGYVLKESADGELVRAAEHIAGGGCFVSPALKYVRPARYLPTPPV
jgi:DNA-binding NarL/FixJ family response regulator